MDEPPNDAGAVAPPIAAVTYQPTVDDLVEVAVLQIPVLSVRQILVSIGSMLFLALVMGFVAVSWYRSGSGTPATFTVIFIFVFFTLSASNLIFRKRRVRQAMQKFYAGKKNISLLVPATARLYSDYVQTDSRLSAGNYAWEIVEDVSHQGGYLLMSLGGLAVYVPDRAFGSPEDAQAFHHHAFGLFNQSRAHQPDLAAGPPWA